MDVKQAAEKWGCDASTVRSYCRSGIIPSAQKIRRKWVIPDNCDKPPMTRHGLCFLIDTFYQIKEGADAEKINWGYLDPDVKSGCKYLIESAFVTSFNFDRFKSEWEHVTITPRGKDLIQREYQESKGKFAIKSVSLRVMLGLPGVAAELEINMTSNN